VTSREFIRWARKSEPGGFPWWIAIAAAFAGFVAWRGTTGAWLAGAIVAYAFAFLRVPFLMYWRADASLLAQLPIEGAALFDAALYRCVVAAAITTAVVCAGAAPLADVRPLIFAGALGLAAAFMLPAAVVWSAVLVANDQLAAVAGAQTSAQGASATLGAIPGFAATAILAPALIASPWLTGGTAKLPAPVVLGAIAAISVLAIASARAGAAKVMAVILRDVSALDRQRLATLEIRPPTAIERAIGGLLGDAALPYAKTARLMRRRYPMAFALGALAFLVLAIIGLAQAPVEWLIATLVGVALYAGVLAGRLGVPPIELPRLALPFPRSTLRRARRAWLVGWWAIFVLAPGLFAALRTEPTLGGALLGAGTLLVLII